MAEEKAAAAESAPSNSGGGKSPMILMALAVINMAVVGVVGYMLYAGRKADDAKPKLEDVIQGEKAAQEADALKEKVVVGTVIPLETFIVNLAGSKGRRIAKVNMEIEVDGKGIEDEIDKRKAQIRDIIIILLSGKTYDEVSTREGKEQLRSEIKDTVNAFLTSGKILQVYFTEFLYQ